ncbi:hypothetical protein PSHT_11149 [Puccinia striiformis]|uniref:Uncharacterized protein n=1 Tax=Puccinia striiformis TaxID=27350 RepID=A0A2S4V549_9BASI|nr:hypothetical protein PSHT_11149 [Puccinia striiformis]
MLTQNIGRDNPSASQFVVGKSKSSKPGMRGMSKAERKGNPGEATSRQGRTQRLTGCFRFYQTTHWESFEQSPNGRLPTRQ